MGRSKKTRSNPAGRANTLHIKNNAFPLRVSTKEGYRKMHANGSMSSHAGRAMCRQLLGLNKKTDALYMPPTLENSKSGDLATLSGGTAMEFTNAIDISANAAGNASLAVSCSDTGFNNGYDVLYTLNTWAATSVPSATDATVLSTSSVPLSPYAYQANRGDVTGVVVKQQLRLISNSASAMNRAGKVFVGWVPKVDIVGGLTAAVLQQMPGIQQYDLAQAEDEHYPIFSRPPWAMAATDFISTDGYSYTGESKPGHLIVLATGMPASACVLTFELNTTIFYYGRKVGVTDFPVISQSAYDCAMTCWIAVFGRTVSFTPKSRNKVVAAVDHHAGVHTLAHTAEPLVHTAFEKAKEWGMKGLRWLGNKVVGFLPSLASLLL